MVVLSLQMSWERAVGAVWLQYEDSLSGSQELGSLTAAWGLLLICTLLGSCSISRTHCMQSAVEHVPGS